jgi:hypothetical protein
MGFALSDFFVVGLGCDLFGAWLLARGVIADPSVIVLRTGNYWGGNPAATVAAADGRVDARFGVGVPLIGYALQALGTSSGSDSGMPASRP